MYRRANAEKGFASFHIGPNFCISSLAFPSRWSKFRSGASAPVHRILLFAGGRQNQVPACLHTTFYFPICQTQVGETRQRMVSECHPARITRLAITYLMRSLSKACYIRDGPSRTAKTSLSSFGILETSKSNPSYSRKE